MKVRSRVAQTLVKRRFDGAFCAAEGMSRESPAPARRRRARIIADCGLRGGCLDRATQPQRTVWRVGDLVIDEGQQRVTRGEEVIELPKLSFEDRKSVV